MLSTPCHYVARSFAHSLFLTLTPFALCVYVSLINMVFLCSISLEHKRNAFWKSVVQVWIEGVLSSKPITPKVGWAYLYLCIFVFKCEAPSHTFVCVCVFCYFTWPILSLLLAFACVNLFFLGCFLFLCVLLHRSTSSLFALSTYAYVNIFCVCYRLS